MQLEQEIKNKNLHLIKAKTEHQKLELRGKVLSRKLEIAKNVLGGSENNKERIT